MIRALQYPKSTPCRINLWGLFIIFPFSYSKHLLSYLVAVAIATIVPSVSANVNTNHKALVGRTIKGMLVTETDAAILEPVCVLVLTNGTGHKYWYDVLAGNPILDLPQFNMAKNAVSLHHYCYAELARNKYFTARDKKKKGELVGIMISDYKFMVTAPEYLPKDWKYMAHMFVKYGEALLLAGKEVESVRAFQQAFRHDVRYDKAYIAIADYFAKKGNRDQALAQVTEGLRHRPDSRRLKRLYADYGGKLPYPSPYSMPLASSPVVTDLKEDLKSIPSNANEHIEENPSHTLNPVVRQQGIDNNLKGTSDQEDAIVNNNSAKQSPYPGSVGEQVDTNTNPKNNPYCRFCP